VSRANVTIETRSPSEFRIALAAAMRPPLAGVRLGVSGQRLAALEGGAALATGVSGRRALAGGSVQAHVYGEVVLSGESLRAVGASVAGSVRPMPSLMASQGVTPLEGLTAVVASVIALRAMRVHVRGEVLLEPGGIFAQLALQDDVARSLGLLRPFSSRRLARLLGKWRHHGDLNSPGKADGRNVRLLLLMKCQILKQVRIELQFREGLRGVVGIERVAVVGRRVDVRRGGVWHRLRAGGRRCRRYHRRLLLLVLHRRRMREMLRLLLGPVHAGVRRHSVQRFLALLEELLESQLVQDRQIGLLSVEVS